MLNFKIVVNELPNTSWNDPQVIIMIVTLIATCVFSFLLYRTSEKSAKVAEETLQFNKVIRGIEQEQENLLKRLKRKEVFDNINEAHKVLFDFSRCNSGTFQSRWISELHSIKQPSPEDLSKIFNEEEVNIINNIFCEISKFIKEKLIDSRQELKGGFNGNDLDDVIKTSRKLYNEIKIKLDIL